MPPFFMPMKSVLLSLCLFFVCVVQVDAQALWSSEGATWHYTRTEEYWPARPRPLLYDFTRVSVGPTKVINGKTCHSYEVSNPDSCNPLIGTFYCYEEARKLYYYYEDSNTFSLLYDFSLSPGDSLLSKSDAGVLITYIDSVSSMKVGDTTLSVQYVHYSSNGIIDHPNRLFITHPKNENFNIEGIGNTFNFFPWWFGLCHNVRATNLRCFENSDLRYFYDTQWTNQCDSTFFWEPQSVGSPTFTSVKLYPNPANDIVNIEGLPDGGKLRLFNAMGKDCALTWPTSTAQENSFSVSHLPSGIYLLQIENTEYQQTFRLLVE